MTKEGLFSGEVKSTFTIMDMVAMYKIGWRSLEGITLHPKHWATNEELEEVALAHVETLLRVKMDALNAEIEIEQAPKPSILLSIVPPGEPSNEN
jgi:hypothetical protein